MHRSLSLALLLALALPACRSPVTRRPLLEALPLPTQHIVLDWLNTDCEAQDGRARKLILEVGPILEPVFWEAFELGPLPSQEEADRPALAARYASRNEYLRSADARALMSSADIEEFLDVSESDYVDAELERARTGYRTAALLGLSLVGSTRSRDELEELAADDSSPFQEAARRALDSAR